MTGGVEFDEENSINPIASRNPIGDIETPGMIRWLMKKGVIRTQGQGTIILIIIMLIMFGASAVVLFMYTPLRNTFRRPAPRSIPLPTQSAQPTSPINR
jgi:hypothetical protein